MKRGLLLCTVAASAMMVYLAQARAAGEFPFGLEMTLDAAPLPGVKRRPTLDLGDNGETRVELWCGGGKGQISVAGNTIIFVAGAMETRSCTPAQIEADSALLAALNDIATWKREGDAVTLLGSKPLRFRINTN